MEKLNINDKVKVKMTEYGKQCLVRNYEKLSREVGTQVNPPSKNGDQDGWSEWQLWHLIQEFGPHMALDGALPFETTILLIPPNVAGKQALPEPLCVCKDRVLSACPGEWEPGCDLGNNPDHVRGCDGAVGAPVERRVRQHCCGRMQTMDPILKDGDPAFPQKEPLGCDSQGMSLRDYFAARIMATFLMGAKLPPGFDAKDQIDFTAGRAYECADAMLRARAA